MTAEREKVINISDSSGNDRFVPLQRYLVLYIDVVGQSKKLENLQAKFLNPFETQLGFPTKTINDIQDAFKDVFAVRKSFLKSLEQARESYFKRQGRVFKVEPKIIFASDGLFIWVKLPDENSLDELVALMITMNALAASQMTLFSREIFFKAGACISYGFEHPDFKDDYYGPGLARVAYLEEKAPFPCVLLDRNVKTLIKSFFVYAQEIKNQPIQEHCLQLLDFIGDEIEIESQNGIPNPYVFFPYRRFHKKMPEAYDEVITSLEQQSQRLDLPSKIRDKYKRLLKLINSSI